MDSLEVLVVEVLGEPLAEPQLDLVDAQLQKVVHQGNLAHVTFTYYVSTHDMI